MNCFIHNLDGIRSGFKSPLFSTRVLSGFFKTKMDTKEIYKMMSETEPLVVQSNLNGHYSKRMETTPESILTIEHNHRKVSPMEVVFDIDCHVRAISNEVWDEISTHLQNDDISHSCWDTSRSPHIHCFFKDMANYPNEQRWMLRKIILKHYSGVHFKWIDKGIISDKRMIRDFNSTHEITGHKKTCIYEYLNHAKTHLNAIPRHILNELRMWVANQRMQKIEALKANEGHPDTNSEERSKLEKFLEFCLSHKFAVSGMCKNNHLFKNIGFAICILEYPYPKIKVIDALMSANCKGEHKGDVIEWVNWIKKQPKVYEIRWREVEKYGFK